MVACVRSAARAGRGGAPGAVGRAARVIEARDAELAAAGAALAAAEARIAALGDRVAELERRLGKDSGDVVEAAVVRQPVSEEAQGSVAAWPERAQPGQAAGRRVIDAAAGG
jgi:hypothetical protein